MVDQAFAPHLAAVRDYLCGIRWQRDPSSGQCQLYAFNSDVNELAQAFYDDAPRFPRSSVCALLQSPEVGVLGDAVQVILPEMFAGEFDVVRDALEFACDLREGNVWGAVLAVASAAVAVGGFAHAIRNDPPASAFGRRSSSPVRPSRPPQSLSRPSRR